MNVATILAGIAALVVWGGVIGASVAAWIIHVIVCIKAGAWILLAFGCIVVPVGVIHGAGVWLGIF